MPDPIVYGFPRSTFVNIVRLILTHKDVTYQFHDLEPVMGKPDHLALHPFNRVPILRHGDLTIYETSAIAVYVDEAFDGAHLTPKDFKTRARMNQWVSAVNSYYYPYMIYHVTHERLVFPRARHRLRREGRRACAAQGRNGALGRRTRACPRQKLPVGRRAHDRGFLSAAEHLCVQPDGRGTVPVSEVSGVLPVAGTHGQSAGNPKGARRRATRSDPTCPRMGELAPAEILTAKRRCRGGRPPLGSTHGEAQAPRQTASPSKPCATLGISEAIAHGRNNLARTLRQRHEVIMSLKTAGVIEIPGAAGSAFDHGTFDTKSRRAFIAHTKRSTIEVIDPDAGRHITTLPGFPGAAGAVADDGEILVTNRGSASIAWLDAATLRTRSVLATAARPNGAAIVKRLALRIAACIGDEKETPTLQAFRL